MPRCACYPTGTGSMLAHVTAAAVNELDLHPGKAVHFSVKATAVTLYPGRRADGPVDVTSAGGASPIPSPGARPSTPRSR